ncbi:MAG: hypothetical protein HGA67_01230 [Candidatus Yonathbacteria bacterium]|nr:hypothetical protein [Candidatus Yonathbacteria bacterium]
MQQYTQEQVEERFNNLPEDIQRVLGSAETGDALRRIGERNQLHIDKLEVLNDITVHMMIGLAPRAGYVQAITHELGVSEITARQIAEEVNSEILAPIRASLEKLHETYSTPKEKVAEEPVKIPEIMPSREDVLREIENPTPTASTTPESQAQKTPSNEALAALGQAFASDRPNLPTIPPNDLPVAPTPSPLEPKPSFLDQKLGGTVRIPPASTVEQGTPLSPSTPSNDPYREPFDA